jgi:tetratricopeptide (TPR) repeat protein
MMSGEYDEALRLAEEIARSGEDSGDRQTRCLGLYSLGAIQSQMGRTEEAFANSEQAVDLSEVSAHHFARALAGAALGMCYLRQGNLSAALEVLRSTEAWLQAHPFAEGAPTVSLRLAWSATYLSLAETTGGPERFAHLAEAGRHCRKILRIARRYYHGAFPDAMRYKGTYEWLKGRRSAARKWWIRGLKLADELGMPFNAASLHLEMGKRLNDHEHLKQAEAIFADIGAEWDLAETRRFLEGVQM